MPQLIELRLSDNRLSDPTTTAMIEGMRQLRVACRSDVLTCTGVPGGDDATCSAFGDKGVEKYKLDLTAAACTKCPSDAQMMINAILLGLVAIVIV